MTNIEGVLADQEVFNHFPPEVQKHLAEYALPRKLERGEYLCRQGEIWPYVVYLSSGQLRWSMLSAAGKEHQLFVLDPGEMFWAHSFFDDQPMPASLKAVKAVETLVWSQDRLLPLFKRYPEALWAVTAKLTRIMREAREIIYGLAFQPVASRLAGYLLDKIKVPGQETLEREMTLEDMAVALASSPEVVCRLLYQFQSEGIIKINRTQITFHDREALEKLVDLS